MNNPSVVSYLITLLLAAAVCTQGGDVKDKDGNSVEINKKYFIQPVKSTSNDWGGLVPAPPNLFPFCPLGVSQSLSDLPGLPVSFAFPKKLMGTTVSTSTDVTIEFKSNFWPFCDEYSKLWKVDGALILIGGEPEEKSSWFKIEKAEGENTYKLTSTSSGTTVRTAHGLFGPPKLVLSKDNKGETLLVKFKKVDDDATTAATSTSRVEKLGLRMFPFY